MISTLLYRPGAHMMLVAMTALLSLPRVISHRLSRCPFFSVIIIFGVVYMAGRAHDVGGDDGLVVLAARDLAQV